MPVSNEEMTSFAEELQADAMVQQGLYGLSHLAFESVILEKIADLLDIEDPTIT